MTSGGRRPLIVETHMHLDDAAFDGDRKEVLAAAKAAGVVHFVNIGYEPASWESSQRLRERHPEVALTLGLHPQHADAYGPSLDREFRQLIHVSSPIAIGETGFDFARSGPSLEQQERAFRRQLEIAAEEKLPVVIHQRDAADALMLELDRWPDLAPIVLHSFDGNERLMDWAIERRCYIGIGGLAAKRSAGPLRELLRRAPTDRLLLETDSPYLAPPKSPSRRNVPANLPVLAELHAPIWNLSAEELCCITTDNATAVFGLRPN